MRVFITGVAGFLGTNLANYHIQRGDEVFGIDNFSAQHSKHFQQLIQNRNFHFTSADLCTWNDFKSIFPNVSLIYHLAAVVGVLQVLNQPERVLNSNIIGLQRLMEAIVNYAPHARVILASSSEVYGQQKNKNVKLSEDMPACIDVTLKTRINYPVSKLVQEAYGLTYHQTHGLQITILRLFNAIGIGQISNYGMVVPRFIQAAKSGQALQVFGNGQQKRTFCDVRDVIGFVTELIDSKDSIGQIVNVGGMTSIKILDLAKRIIKLSNSSSSIEFMTYDEAYHLREDFIRYRCPNLSRLYSLVCYRPQYSLTMTLQDLIHNNDA